MAFNSREYEWADVTVIAGGVDLMRIRGVKWSRKREGEHLYGKGRDPISNQFGNNSYEMELTMTQKQFDQLESSANDDIFSLKLDILVAFGNPSQGDAVRKHRAIGVSFTEDTFELKQGDKFGEYTVPALPLKINKNV